jgi:hypothetical protein
VHPKPEKIRTIHRSDLPSTKILLFLSLLPLAAIIKCPIQKKTG